MDTGNLRSNWSQEPTRITKDSIVTLYNNTEYAKYVDQGTPRMRAQPMIEPCKMSIASQAELLSKALTKKVYDV